MQDGNHDAAQTGLLRIFSHKWMNELRLLYSIAEGTISLMPTTSSQPTMDFANLVLERPWAVHMWIELYQVYEKDPSLLLLFGDWEFLCLALPLRPVPLEFALADGTGRVLLWHGVNYGISFEGGWAQLSEYMSKSYADRWYNYARKSWNGANCRGSQEHGKSSAHSSAAMLRNNISF